jgi:ketosteroid isomerase-like protein
MRTLGSLNRAVRASLLTAAVMFIGYSSVIHAQSTDAFLTKYMAAVNIRMPPSGDPATVAELFTEDGVQYHVFGEPPGGPQRGREALARFFGGFKEAFADWTHIERSRFIQGNWAVWEGIAEGHEKKSGKPLRLPIVFFLEFDDQGKVREDRVYVDMHLIGEQLK